jgi:octaprenyl-diphosphate synthase
MPLPPGRHPKRVPPASLPHVLTRAQPAATMARAAAPAALFGRLKPHLSALDEFLRQQLTNFEPEIRDFAAYCVDTSGKRIRPALVFFSGWTVDEAVSEVHVRLAAVIEMVHLATLVHDDIMDEADLRRNRRTAAREFGRDTAVLLGDALFAQALHIAAQFPTTEVCLRVAASTRQVCSGEIMQTLSRRDAVSNVRAYRRVIELKTAELFHVSCLLGARLAPTSAEFAGAAGQFGKHLGTAYQIYDDLADFFGDETKIGKTLGTDLASGKATLPLLLLLERLPPAESASLRREMAEGDTSHLGRRVAQMTELNIFRDVLADLHEENARAVAALEPWNGSPPCLQLRELAQTLETQATSLKSAR